MPDPLQIRQLRDLSADRLSSAGYTPIGPESQGLQVYSSSYKLQIYENLLKIQYRWRLIAAINRIVFFLRATAALLRRQVPRQRDAGNGGRGRSERSERSPLRGKLLPLRSSAHKKIIARTDVPWSDVWRGSRRSMDTNRCQRANQYALEAPRIAIALSDDLRESVGPGADGCAWQVGVLPAKHRASRCVLEARGMAIAVTDEL